MLRCAAEHTFASIGRVAQGQRGRSGCILQQRQAAALLYQALADSQQRNRGGVYCNKLPLQAGGYGEVAENALNAQDIAGPSDAPAFSISRAFSFVITSPSSTRISPASGAMTASAAFLP